MCTEDVNVKKEEEIKDTNNSSSEGEEKDLNAQMMYTFLTRQRRKGLSFPTHAGLVLALCVLAKLYLAKLTIQMPPSLRMNN